VSVDQRPEPVERVDGVRGLEGVLPEQSRQFRAQKPVLRAYFVVDDEDAQATIASSATLSASSSPAIASSMSASVTGSGGAMMSVLIMLAT